MILAVAVAACAQPRLDPTDVLAHARDKLLDRTDRIPNYICVETVNRSYLKNADAKSWPGSCDQILGAKTKGDYKLRIEATDRLRLDVKVSDGREIGAWAGARSFDSRDIIEFVGDGPFGTGPLGTLIGDIFPNRGTRFEYDGEEILNQTGVFKFSYQVPVESSHYLIKAISGWATSAFSGSLWIDRATFDLLRLSAGTSELPPETLTCATNVDVTYERERIGARDFLLPRRSDLHFVMRDSTETHSVTTYSDCHEYHAESTLRFDEAPTTEAAGKGPVGVSAPALPAGLKIRLVLQTPIDTDTAAAGDMFTAKVAKAVHSEHSKKTIIPASSVVRGRIVHMQHVLGSPPYFQIAIRPQSIEIDGAELPFDAVLDRSGEFAAAPKTGGLSRRGVPIFLPPSGQSPNVGALVFPTSNSRLVVPRGQESDWITSAPK